MVSIDVNFLKGSTMLLRRRRRSGGPRQTHPLVDLLATNIMQAAVEITHTLHDILDLVLVLGLDLARLTNGNVQGELHGALAAGHPARGRDVGFGRKADPVLAGVGGREGEAAGVVFALVHDAVVVIEGLIDGD